MLDVALIGSAYRFGWAWAVEDVVNSDHFGKHSSETQRVAQRSQPRGNLEVNWRMCSRYIPTGAASRLN